MKKNTHPWCFLPSCFPHRQPREVTITQRRHRRTLYKVAAAAAAAAATPKVVETEAGRRAARVKSQEWAREWRRAHHSGTIQSAAGVFAVVKKRMEKKKNRLKATITWELVIVSPPAANNTECERGAESCKAWWVLTACVVGKKKKRCTLLVKLVNKSQPTLSLARPGWHP